MRSRLRRQGRWVSERQLKRRDGRLLWVQVSKRRVDDANAQATDAAASLKSAVSESLQPIEC